MSHRVGSYELVLIGDAAVHPALLEELVDRDVLVGCGHYPGGGIGRIVRRNGMTVWETE